MSRIVLAAIGSLGDLHPHLAIALLTQFRPTTRAILLIGRNEPPADLPDNILAVKYAPYLKS